MMPTLHVSHHSQSRSCKRTRHQAHRPALRASASAHDSKPGRNLAKGLPPDALQMFYDAQSNILELNRSRLQALEELKLARDKISQLEAQLGRPPSNPQQDQGRSNNSSSQTATMYIHYPSGWPKAFAHYCMDGQEWTKSPGVQLEGRSGDWKLELPANKVEIAFNDGSNDWDTPGYGQNYTINSPGSYRITGGKVKEL